MNKLANSLVILGLIFGASTVVAADPKADSKTEARDSLALASANSWMALVDKKQYKQSWEEAAVFFKSKVSSREWEQTVEAVRSPFGALVSRKLKSKTYTKALPGAPEGEYVVIQYEAQYKNRKNVTETVTPMLDESVWRVSGYFAK